MSAMLETYDMPMHDYQNDLDIQMHPSSDQWFPNEAQMEEDGPGGSMKPENYSPPKGDGSSQMKTDTYSHEKAEITIEVDMEPFSEHHNVAEYDMEADEDIHHSGGENLDVDVYDVSLVQSPLITAGEIVQDGPSNFVGSFDHTETATLSHNTSPLNAHTSELTPLEPEIVENPSLHDFTASHDVPVESYDFQLDSGPEVQAPAEFSEPVIEQEHIVSSSESFLESHFPEKPTPNNPLPTEITRIPDASDTVAVASINREEGIVDDNQAPNQDDHADIEASDATENVLGDPHEISEGVYIDPPPPVLLSVDTEDHFDCSLFNESPDWNTSSRSEGQSHQAGLVLLQHFPTLYYEPLSAVFDALRLEQYVQSMFHLPESELVLDAVDLQLTISEDNVYAREVTLHDLNVLHDVSSINGQLRMRLYASTPRFITRYQYLQGHVSQLNLEPPSDVPLAEINNLEEAPLEETQEVPPEEHPTQEHVEDHVSESVHTGEVPNDTYEQGNQNDGHNEAESEAHTTESFDPEINLPPLPAEDDEEEEAEEEPSLLHGDFDSSLSTGGGLDSSEQHPAPETEGEQPYGLNEPNVNAIISLEALEASGDNSHADGEGVHEEEVDGEGEDGEGEDGDREDGEVVDENGAVAEDEEHGVEEYQATGDNAELDHREEDNLEQEYAEHKYHEHAEEEYVEEEPAANDQGDEYYQEDGTASHDSEDQLDYVEEANFTLEIQTLDAPPADLAEFDDVHSNADEGIADEFFAGPGSLHEQAANDVETDGDHIFISQPDTTEQEYDGLATKTNAIEQTATKIGTETETETEARKSEAEQDGQFEDGAELENKTFLESMTDPTLQEAYSWEDDFDAEGDPETPLEGDNEDAPSHSNHSSVTLSSKASKRSFDDFEFEDGYENEDGHWSPPSSPDPKRTRTH